MNDLVSVNEFKGNEFTEELIRSISTGGQEVAYWEKSNCPICGKTMLNEHGACGNHIFNEHGDRYKKQAIAGNIEQGEIYVTEFWLNKKDAISKEVKRLGIKQPPYLIYAEYKDNNGNFKMKLCEPEREIKYDI